jgi:hypothetical protein
MVHKIERELCPELQAINAAWPALPPALKAGIVAMVKASAEGPPGL